MNDTTTVFIISVCRAMKNTTTVLMISVWRQSHEDCHQHRPFWLPALSVSPPEPGARFVSTKRHSTTTITTVNKKRLFLSPRHGWIIVVNACPDFLYIDMWTFLSYPLLKVIPVSMRGLCHHFQSHDLGARPSWLRCVINYTTKTAPLQLPLQLRDQKENII